MWTVRFERESGTWTIRFERETWTSTIECELNLRGYLNLNLRCLKLHYNICKKWIKNVSISIKIRMKSVFQAFWSVMVAAHGLQKLQETQKLLGPHFEGSSRSRSLSRGLWKRSQMRIAWKVNFHMMSLTKSVLLEIHWTFKSFFKPPAALALIHKFSNFDLDNKKKELQLQNSEINTKHCYLQCFERLPWLSRMWRIVYNWCCLEGISYIYTYTYTHIYLYI